MLYSGQTMPQHDYSKGSLLQQAKNQRRKISFVSQFPYIVRYLFKKINYFTEQFNGFIQYI